MTDAEVLALGDRLCNFLISCGGAYSKITSELVYNVFFALGSNQYVIKEDNGEIIWFMAYWKVHKNDVEAVMDRMRPVDLSHGTVAYISEAGNKRGRKGMAAAITAVREQFPQATGVFWHRPAKQDKVYHYPSQRGKGGIHGQ